MIGPPGWKTFSQQLPFPASLERLFGGSIKTKKAAENHPSDFSNVTRVILQIRSYFFIFFMKMFSHLSAAASARRAAASAFMAAASACFA